MKSLPLRKPKILRIPLCFACLCIAALCAPSWATGNSVLDKKISIRFADITLTESLEIMAQQAGCSFSYSSTLLPMDQKISRSFEHKSIRFILNSLLGKYLLNVTAKGQTIILVATVGRISGYITDKNNNPISYGTITLENTGYGSVANDKGYYELKCPHEGIFDLSISAMGYESLQEQIEITTGQHYNRNFHLHESTVQMNEVVVRANRNVTASATRTLTAIKDLPMPVMVIDNRQLEMMGSRRLNEVLQEQTGLALTTDPSGASSSVGLQVQGFDASYTMIMIDGQPLIGRNSVGILDLSRITVANIDRIEVIKGTSSAMYGSDALAGVVNIITKDKQNNNYQGMTSVKYGSNNVFDATLDGVLPIKKDKLTANVNTNFYRTDGFDADNTTPGKTQPPYHSYALQGSIHYLPSEKSFVKLSARYAKRHQNNHYNLDLLGEREDTNIEKDFSASALVKNSLSQKVTLQSQYYFTQYNAITSSSGLQNNEISNNEFTQYFHRIESYANYNIHNNVVLTTGAGANVEQLQATRYGSERLMNTVFAYLQGDYKPTEKLGLLAGVRYDGHNIYGWQLSPRLGVRYTVNKQLTLKATGGSGFKAPSFQQLYLSFTNPSAGYTVLGASVFDAEIERMQNNGEIKALYTTTEQVSSLEAEHSLSFNAGFMWTPSSTISVEFNGFYNDIDNMIFEELAGLKQNGSQIYTYRNIDQAFTKGTEINVSWSALPQLTFSVGHQLLYAKDKGVIDEIEAGETEIRTPEGRIISPQKSDYFNLSNRSRHMANFKVFYEYLPLGTALSVRVNYRGKYGIGDRNYPNNFIDPYDLYASDYILLNATVEKRILKHQLTAQFICDNITNYNDPLIPNMAGRQFLLSLSWQFTNPNRP